MKLPIYLIITLMLFVVAPVHAAAGGSPGGDLSQQSMKKLTPEEKAASRYRAGLKHRDKAAKYEQRLINEQNDKKLAKLQKKIAKEYNKAIDDFERAIEYYPHFHEVHSSLGYALRKVGRFDESLLAYNTSLRINPSYGEAIEYRGEAYLGLNRLDDAKQAYMDLFQSDVALADQLLVAMIAWVTSQRDNPAGMESDIVEQFAAWVDQRNELASYVRPTDRTAPERWAE